MYRTVNNCLLMSPFNCCEAGITWRWNSFIFIFQKARSSPSDNTRTDTTQEQELAQSFDYVATLCREDSNEVIVSYLWLSVFLNLGCVLPWWPRPSPKTCLPSRFSPRDLTITSTKILPDYHKNSVWLQHVGIQSWHLTVTVAVALQSWVVVALKSLSLQNTVTSIKL